MDKPLELRVEFLNQADELLNGLRMGGVGIWCWQVDSDLLGWSDNLESVHALPPGSFDGTLSSFRRDIHPDDIDDVWHRITAAVETGQPYLAVYRTNPRSGSGSIWIEARGGLVTDADGRRYLTGVCLDVSDRERGRRELEQRLRQQQAIERIGSFALAETDFQKIMDEAVRVAAETLGVPLAKILQFADSADRLLLRAGVGWSEGLVGHAHVGTGHDSQAGFTLIEGGPVIVEDLLSETRFNGPALLHDHGVRSGMSLVVPGSEKRPFGVFGVHTREPRAFAQADIDFFVALSNIVANAARQHAAAAQRNLLLREMAHRAGNMLQLVSTIANQTFQAGRDVAEAKQVFSDRLGSLSRANHLISRGGWTATRFRQLVEEALDAFAGRIAFSGRDVMLAPELSFDLGLVLHELATNSAKYGTLGQESGDVDVSWEITTADEADRRFRLNWHDPVSRVSEPAPRGFGTRLIDALVVRKWGGSVVRQETEGYRLVIDIPLARKNP